jgi:mannose-1-phosphate guanylyltransferase
MVLGAGFGTRLRPLSDETPKPLLPLGDRSLLRTLCEQLAADGARRLVVNAHYKAEQVLEEAAQFPFAVSVSVEDRLLGTAGGIRHARPWFLPGDVVVLNGDIVGPRPAPKLMAALDPALLVLAVVPRAMGGGTVGIGAKGEVVRLRGELFGPEVSGADYMGAARLRESALLELPEVGCLIGDYALPLLRAHERVGTVRVLEPFSDVGDPLSYFLANISWLRAHTEPPHVYFGPGAQVGAKVEARLCSLGARVSVLGEGTLERVVALPGASVVAPLRDAIVTREGQVVRVLEEGFSRAD